MIEIVQFLFATMAHGMEQGCGGRKWLTQIYVEQRIQICSRIAILWGRKPNAKKE
jgi:hypothetical protein